MSNDVSMNAKEAIKYVVDQFDIPSKYALSKMLSDDKINVQVNQISNYLKGKKMSRKVATRFYETFGIVISDTYVKTNWVHNE